MHKKESNALNRPSASFHAIYALQRTEAGGQLFSVYPVLLRQPLSLSLSPLGGATLSLQSMNKNSFLIQLSEGPRTDFGRVSFAEQPEPQKVFSSIWALESQVNNGGFLQYFVSSDFDTANFAPTALASIGAHACASIVGRALHLLPSGGVPSSRAASEQEVGSLSDQDREQFEALDTEFMAYPDDLTELLFAYVAARPAVFGPTPQ